MPETTTRLLIVVALAAVCGVPAAPVSANEAAGPFENVKVVPVPATWQYSNNGGQTFIKTPHAAPPPGDRNSKWLYAWRGTFEVADPAKIAGLWVRLVEKSNHPNTPRASICNGNLVAASGGYWKDLGFCPTLLDAVITLNGKEVPIADGRGPVLYFWVPVTGNLQKGANTIELRGNVYTYWGGGWFAGGERPAEAIDARLVAAEAQPAKIYNGPILGDFGDGYFTLACRTQMPADLVVEATPTEPAAAPVTVVSKQKIWHRVKVEIPKGTRKVSYTVTAKVGPHETKRGPYDVAFPGKEFRFVAFGNVYGHKSAIDLWRTNAQAVSDAAPAFIVNTGNPMEHGTWQFNWEDFYIKPTGDLLARVPTLITPCNRDFAGVFNELHYTPGADGYGHNWSKVVGPVRFIGLDGNQTWAAGNANYKWLETELKAAKEKFVVVLDSYAGYSSGVNSKRRNYALDQSRDVVLPLLGKYKATVMLCSWDPDYERCEPAADKGVTQIVTGAIGKASMHRWSGVIASNPFGPGPEASSRVTNGKCVYKGREWCGWVGLRHYCAFDVKGDVMEMNVQCVKGGSWGWGRDLGLGKPGAMDKKTFKARK